MKINPWDAQIIRYIKLGEGGKWAGECFEEGRIRLGFSSGLQNIYDYANNGRWNDVRQYWQERGLKPGVVTSYTNQMQEFFEDDGSTLWVTIENGCIYYGFSDGGLITPSLGETLRDDSSSFRSMSENGWSNLDKDGNLLRIDRLHGALTQVAGFRGTICSFRPGSEEYLRLKLKGELSEDVARAQATRGELIENIKPLIKSLTWRDFEILVELIFSSSGWRRTSSTGGVQKTIDIQLENSVTGDSAFVQVKSTTTQAELNEYIGVHTNSSHFSRMFFVYHTSRSELSSSDKSVSVWNLQKVSEQVLTNGLVDWVINRAT